ncbi:DUF6415 family natural product biosynthesis protein [Streptomyces longisporoflavus]|uniref:DUF6415 family natural product biosynthesis protein n=1 Tax=Streptomyces longisporoflavus TaxID=28044 RepID=UPI00167E3A84|nr:DUF6415 family natural product biosynthesis protein [Streptomyces longisporoflavus]
MPAPTGSHDVPRWTPPLRSDELRFVLDKITAWTPLDVAMIFDDLDTAIGDRPPPAATTAALAERLRVHLKRLGDIAVADPNHPPAKKKGRLIEQARLLRDQTLPTGHQETVGLTRRLAFVVADLAEVLIETGCIKDGE